MLSKFKKQKKKGSGEEKIFQVLFPTLILLLVGFLIFSNIRIEQKRGELSKKIEGLKQEIQSLEERNEKLKAGISQTGNEDYWEEKAREQGYKKLGEEQVVVLPPAGNEASTSSSKSIWGKLLDPIRNFLK